MNKVLCGLLLSAALYAGDGFAKGVEYTCLNTEAIESGKTYEIKKEDAEKNLFIFTLKEDKLTTKDGTEFTFKMKRGDMLSYSNEALMLLLMKDNKIGIVPKKSKGQLQYYFKCKIK